MREVLTKVENSYGASTVLHLSATRGDMTMSIIPNDSSQLALSYQTIRQRIGPCLHSTPNYGWPLSGRHDLFPSTLS